MHWIILDLYICIMYIYVYVIVYYIPTFTNAMNILFFSSTSYCLGLYKLGTDKPTYFTIQASLRLRR